MWALGLRYRLGGLGLPGSPDFAFPGSRLVVFVDGDFWHGRDLRVRLKRLRVGHNASYWAAKISGNVARDRAVSADLRSGGWEVVRIWESRIREDPAAAARLVRKCLGRRQIHSRKTGLVSE
jgi:DNA G:T-mismatch repair endonuclease